MDDERIMQKPIGWWLKEADAGLEAAFDTRLRGHRVDRRSWQVMASLARSPLRRSEVIESLSPFGEETAIDGVVAALGRSGWIEESGGKLHLTPSGVTKHAALASSVAEVRNQVAEALPGDDYEDLMRLLSRLATALPPRTGKKAE